MAKKKVRDFNKVKLKLGRTLKRQNETVVNLSKRKILLPKEKPHLKPDVLKEPNAVLYEHIRRLQMSSESAQLSAISCIRSILLPYVKQINADWNAHPLVPYNERSLLSLTNLFGFDFARNDVALQIGDLLEPLDRLSRHSLNAHLPSEIAELCNMIATILSVHPRISCALPCLDSIVLSLLHRSEFWYRNAGVKLLTGIMGARYTVMASLICSSNRFVPFSSVDELEALIDVHSHSLRKSTYVRLLIRQFQSLREDTSLGTTSSRKCLLMATMLFLRDFQYITYLTPVLPHYLSSKLKLHPFLSPVDLAPISFGHASPCSSSATAAISSTWMLTTCNPILDNQSKATVTTHRGGARKRSTSLGNVSLTGDGGNSVSEQKLLTFILREGNHLLDELIHSPSVEVVFALVYAIRCLRIFLETGPSAYSLLHLRTLSDVRTPLAKFTHSLVELLPLDHPGETLVPQTEKSFEADSRTVGDRAGGPLSRKQLKRAAKHAAKLARRQNAALLKQCDASTSQPQCREQQKPSNTSRLCKSEVLAHLLKQQVLQLMWSLAVDGALDTNAARIFSKSLVAFLLSAEQGEDIQEKESLPYLKFLHLISSALAWRWIHCLDFCLLYHLRIRRLSGAVQKLSFFVAPMLTALAYIVHRWCYRQQSFAASRPFAEPAPRVPRLVVRSAGVLVAFLYSELKEQLWSGRSSLFSPRTSAVGKSESCQPLRYDCTWIRNALRDLDAGPSLHGMEDPFVTLAADLCDLVERESAGGDACRSRWVWAAACLNSLAQMKYANVLEKLERSPALCESVELLKDWMRSAEVLQDPLVHLPCPESGDYPSVRSWRCLSAERIYVQDAESI